MQKYKPVVAVHQAKSKPSSLTQDSFNFFSKPVQTRIELILIAANLKYIEIKISFLTKEHLLRSNTQSSKIESLLDMNFRQNLTVNLRDAWM
jgi:hypothetical protein